MAVAQVEERHLLKTLRWYDGFVIALANPGFLHFALKWFEYEAAKGASKSEPKRKTG